jgi:glycosyltransferase involved in cell wall biosynthesis
MLLNKIVVVSSYDVADAAAWSGVPYYYTKALETIARTVVVASPLEPRMLPSAEVKAERSQVLRRVYFMNRDLDLLRARAIEANSLLSRNRDADIVIVFHPPDATFLETSVPIALIHDSTWNQFTTCYPGLRRDLAEESYCAGFIAERAAFCKAKWLIFFSKWAASAACREYPSLTQKICVIPPGGNLEEAPDHDSLFRLIEDRKSHDCKILFIGGEAHRKGLDIAINTTIALTTIGFNVNLRIVGIPKTIPVRPMPIDFSGDESQSEQGILMTYGYLNKSIAEERLLLNQLYSEAFVLLAPSRADCGSLALCDAAAFGLPTVTSGVGGIGDMVIDGKSGLSVGSNATPEAYAETIKTLLQDKSAYSTLCHGARAQYDDVLNWRTHVISLAKMVLSAS